MLIRRSLILLLLAVIALTGRNVPANAQSALSDLVRIEVLDGGPSGDGRHLAALRLELAKGWKTYWRAPGNAGIPPAFEWKGARNVRDVAITWPTPTVFDQNGLRSVGYATALVLPLAIAPRRAGRAIRLAGGIEFGICRDVCIPARLTFSQDLDENAPRHPAIAAALAARPYSAAEAGVSRALCRIEPTADGLRVTARLHLPHTGGEEFTVIESGVPGVWSSEATVSRHGGVLTASSELIHIEGGPFALDRAAVRFTVLGKSRAVDIRGCSAE